MVFDFADVLTQTLQDVVSLSVGDFSFYFRESEVHDVMVVNFRSRKLLGEL